MFASLPQERHAEPSSVFFVSTCEYCLEGRDNRGVELGLNSLSESHARDSARHGITVRAI
jgi:hypothetical protein